MSDVSVDIIKNRSGEAPDLPSGANLSGVSTAATLQVTNLNPTHINASGVTTATTFSGSLKSTGTPTLGLGVTINSSGINISGVATAGIVSATTLYGDGTNLTGIAMSIAPISYQPDVNDTQVKLEAGIGITFTERIKAGTGNITLRLVSAGGTVVENFGVGSSVTISNNTVTINPTANLSADTVYHLSYPSGCFTNTAGDVDYVGTAYTFAVKPLYPSLWLWGRNWYGVIPEGYESDSSPNYSSPVQLAGTTWSRVSISESAFGTKTDGTLWAWGANANGQLGLNNRTLYSSPVQIPGTSWSDPQAADSNAFAIRTDGTLWAWGINQRGDLALNDLVYRSSPTQIPGTWAQVTGTAAINTDGELFTWGQNLRGELGQNQEGQSPSHAAIMLSSPTQIPGTTWAHVTTARNALIATKTNGTLWAWGGNYYGILGQNQGQGLGLGGSDYSSPVQIPGTNWVKPSGGYYKVFCTRTDGTLWAWGRNDSGDFGGALGDGTNVSRSSPVQVLGTGYNTTKFYAYGNYGGAVALKTDGTRWSWGMGGYGQTAQNNDVTYSSPVQIPGEWTDVGDDNGSNNNAVTGIAHKLV